MEVSVGESVRFAWGAKKQMKEGVVVRVFPKRVHIKVDFNRSKGKIVIRKKHELHPA